MKRYPLQRPLKILISGSSGLIGRHLTDFLAFMGHHVVCLYRFRSQQENGIVWNPETGEGDLKSFEGFDVVIQLAGENIGNRRWTTKKKKRVFTSRVKGTYHLTQMIKKLSQPPTTFIGASAIGYYGNCGDRSVDESAPVGRELFVSQVCEKWEKSSQELTKQGIRVIHARFGIVLSNRGGSWKRMVAPFKWGLGGQLGNGRNYMSWIAIDDVVGALYHIINTPLASRRCQSRRAPSSVQCNVYKDSCEAIKPLDHPSCACIDHSPPVWAKRKRALADKYSCPA